MTDFIHHLVSAADWESAGDPYRPPSLDSEGFIHFSSADQIAETSMRYYSDVDDLLVVTVRVDALDAQVVWEDLAGNGDFPHLYGPLGKNAVVAVQPYRPGDEFSYR